jgi:hypothetical protein
MQALRMYFMLIGLYASMFALQAKPMHIYFHEMMAQSETIVGGIYLGHNGTTPYESNQFYFVVQKVYKGAVNNDTLELGLAHGAVHLKPGTTCIAFINGNNEFEWVGNLYNTQKITDNSILQVEGFYDWNAYLVSPSMISVGQLTNYIKTQTFSGNISGDVQFFSNDEKTMKDSPINISVDYHYKNGNMNSQVKINGLPLNDFKNKANLSLPVWNEYLSIEYESNLYRPLEFKGKIMQLHTNDSSWRAVFWLHEPEELTYGEFVDFIKNVGYGHPYYELNIELTNQKAYTIILNDEIGRIGRIIGFNGKDYAISSLSTSPEREIVLDIQPNPYIIILDSCLIPESAFECAGDDLIRELKYGDIPGEIYVLKDNKRTFVCRCNLTYQSTKFTKYPND